MKVLKLELPLKIYLIPRIYPELLDNISLTLRNEMSNEVLTPNITFSVDQKLEITINEELNYFNENDKFEIEVKKDTETIYLGKMVVLNSSVDIQNYEYSQNTTKRYDYK